MRGRGKERGGEGRRERRERMIRGGEEERRRCGYVCGGGEWGEAERV